MRLILQNGYPHPYPERLSDAAMIALAEDASNHTLILDGVTHLQWLHTFTVEFDAATTFAEAQRATGWRQWAPRVLEAPVSAADGLAHPAIVAAERAYGGFIVIPL